VSDADSKLNRRYVRYVLALLALGNLLNYLDRNIIFALFEPIRRELHVSDTQLGWLGSAYAIVFSLGALFAGVLSDLTSRRTVIAGSVALWSGFTAVGGVIRSYWQLFVSRAFVGVGQSAYLPAAQALLADYYPTQGRAQAMGIFWAGLALGGVLAVWLGGVLATAFGWRQALVLVGLPGLLFALLLTRLRDPVARAAPVVARAAAPKFRITWRVAARTVMPLGVSLLLATAVFGFLALFENLPASLDLVAFGVIAGAGLMWTIWQWVRIAMVRLPEAASAPADVVDEMLDAASLVLRTPTLIWLFLGGALTSASMNSLVAWSTSFLQRELDLTLLEAGRRIGPIGLAAGVLGSFTGGRLGDVLFERWPSGRVLAGATGFLVGAPICVFMLLATNVSQFSILFFLVVFLFTWYNGPLAAVLFDVVPREIGATVMGAYVFFIHIAGDAIALPVVGLLSDRYGLRPALLTLPVVGLVGGLILMFAVFTVGRDMQRLKVKPAA
jgi:MFS family permease